LISGGELTLFPLIKQEKDMLAIGETNIEDIGIRLNSRQPHIDGQNRITLL
jgi:hypothetical protein